MASIAQGDIWWTERRRSSRPTRAGLRERIGRISRTQIERIFKGIDEVLGR